LAGVSHQASFSAAKAGGTSKPLHHITAETCKNCHQEIYEQWKGSMPGQSTALQDPIHAAFYQMTVSDPKAEGVLAKETGKYPGCLNCHSPAAAYDANGKAVWQNFKEDPMKEDPKAVFLYMLGDEKGNPAPPPAAKQVLADTRLDPNETRTLEYDIPAENVAVIRAEALYHLLLPSMVKMLDQVLTDELKQPRLAAVTEVRL
jgi:hypothetical protein